MRIVYSPENSLVSLKNNPGAVSEIVQGGHRQNHSSDDFSRSAKNRSVVSEMPHSQVIGLFVVGLKVTEVTANPARSELTVRSLVGGQANAFAAFCLRFNNRSGAYAARFQGQKSAPQSPGKLWLMEL